MLRRLHHVRSSPQGETIEHVRMNEALSTIAFLGRRRRTYGRIVALSGARPGDRVLDVGCGSGYLARLLASTVTATGQVTGVDPSGPAVAYARRRAPVNCSFVTGVAQALDFPDGTFDVVTSTLAIHHVPEAARPEALREMHRVLRPGGRLLVADVRVSRLHLVARPAMRHLDRLEELTSGAGFAVETSGDLPLLRYVAAARTERHH